MLGSAAAEPPAPALVPAALLGSAGGGGEGDHQVARGLERAGEEGAAEQLDDRRRAYGALQLARESDNGAGAGAFGRRVGGGVRRRRAARWASSDAVSWRGRAPTGWSVGSYRRRLRLHLNETSRTKRRN